MQKILRRIINHRLAVPAFLAILAFPLFAPVLLGSRLFSSAYVNFYHEYFFAGQQFLIYHLHQWPLWWPSFFSGYPVDLTVDGFLNPIFIVALKFLPALAAYHWLTYFFFVANLISLYAFARALKLSRGASLIAALAYGMSGILIRWTDVIVFTTMFPILPLSFLACLKIHEGRLRWRWIWTLLLAYAWIAGFAELMAYYLLAVAGFAVFLLLQQSNLDFSAWRTNPIATAWTFVRDGFKKYALPVLLSLLIVSPWLIAVFYFILAHSIRAGGIAFDQASQMALNPSYVLHAFFPQLEVAYGALIPHVPIGVDIDLFIGTIPLLLLATLPFLGRRSPRWGRGFFVGLLVFFFLMSFRSPLYRLLQPLPILRWFRWHFKWTFVTMFAAAILAGGAFDDLHAFFQFRHVKKWFASAWILFGLVMLALTGITLFAEPLLKRLTQYGLAHYAAQAQAIGRALPRSPDYYRNVINIMSHSIVQALSFRSVWIVGMSLLWLAALGALTLGLTRVSNRSKTFALLAATVLGSVVPWLGFLTQRSVSYLQEQPGAAVYLHQHEAYAGVPLTSADGDKIPYRIYTYFPDQVTAWLQEVEHANLSSGDGGNWMSRALLADNINTWLHLDGLNNHEPLGESRTWTLQEIAMGLSVQQVSIKQGASTTKAAFEDNIKYFSSEHTARLYGMMNVKYVTSVIPLSGPWQQVFITHVDLGAQVPVMVYENPFFMPRWYFANHVRWTQPGLPEAEAAHEPSLIDDYRETTLLEQRSPSDPALPSNPDPRDRLDLDLYTAGLLSLRTHTAGYRWVVFSETAAPFWHAQIDGAEAPLYYANHAYQAILVPPGDHLVKFSYPGFWQQTREAIASLLTQP